MYVFAIAILFSLRIILFTLQINKHMIDNIIGATNKGQLTLLALLNYIETTPKLYLIYIKYIIIIRVW